MQTTVSLPQKINGMVGIFRPELPLAAGLCVILGQVAGSGGFPPVRTALTGLALGFFLSASALIINDIFDLEVDRINAPQRPLPSGRVTLLEAWLLGGASALLGLWAAWTFSPLIFGLSVVTWVLGFYYNWQLKSAGIWGNLAVSTSVAMTILIGGISVGQAFHPAIWLAALFAFFFDLAEEIAADAMDAEGDRKRKSRSIAILYGRETALNAACALLGVVVLISLAPVLLGLARLPYLAAAGFADLMIIVFAVRLRRSQTRAEGMRAVRGLYLSLLVGIIAFLIGSLLV